jgi:hypothetical protein
MTILSLLFVVISSIAARQRFGEHVAAATNAFGRVVCYPVVVVSKESKRSFFPRVVKQ